ncbi:MAG: protein adenylyltransferase SelO family protein, partial [Sulfurimonas sp.]
KIVLHLIDREYSDTIDSSLTTAQKVVLLAREFCDRLTSLVADWIRVGYCQGNFNSDNCAAGGFTLDYGPFGFIDNFHPRYQPWTGGGIHFSFLNQPQAAERNFQSFYTAVLPLVESHENELRELGEIKDGFSKVMQVKMINMWSSKLGLETFNADLFNELVTLMMDTSVDYTLFFRELSNIPDDISALTKSFYGASVYDQKILKSWSEWLERWRALIDAATQESREKLSSKMKQVNPKYTLREWFLVPAYKEAEKGDYTLLKELQEVMTDPYGEQSSEIEKRYYRQKPAELFDIAGVSHISCSS